MEDIEAGFMAERPKMKYDIIITSTSERLLDLINYLEENDVGVILWEAFKVSDNPNTTLAYQLPVMLPRDFEWPKGI